MITKELKNKKLIIVITSVVVVLLLLVILFFSLFNINIIVNGKENETIEYGDTYTEEGASASYNTLSFKNKSVDVSISGEVDCSKLGTYHIHYKAKKEGFTATDNYDGDITDKVTRHEKDNVVTYTVSDSSGNKTTVTRTVEYNDGIAPSLTLNGDSHVTIKAGTKYKDTGAAATDSHGNDISDSITVSGEVKNYRSGDYTLTYTATDKFGNTNSIGRTVTVEAVKQADSAAVNPGSKVVYLTFDDGPGAYTQQLLDVLAKYNIKVTFFVTNVNSGYQNMIAKEAAAGHTVAIHSASHNYQQIYSSVGAYFDDLNEMSDIIYSQTGSRPTLVRFPGGSSNSVSKKYCKGIMTELAKDVTDQGYKYYDWNVSSGDAGGTTSTSEVYQNVINGIQSHNVSVVLQHDIKSFSVDAVESIIQWGLANGYTFLPLTTSSPDVHHGINN